MCGITGTVNCLPPTDVLSLINHRGPDYQDSTIEKVGDCQVFLGHTRLAILELSEAGSQPMFSDCGNYCIVFNGEIYNHLQLREKLTHIHFKGHSDTETILYYIKHFGIQSIKDFNGIFAFAFLDKVKRKLYMARDHFGVKPLYYFFNFKVLIFGSELKTIIANNEYKKEIDLYSLNALLSFRYNPAPNTIFKNIFKLKAAHLITFDFDSNTLQCCKYTTNKQKINHQITKQEAIDEYRFYLKQAVKRQLLSDVPVGLLLSGGLDSAVLGYWMARLSDKPIKTFTIGFEGKGDYNELAYAKQTANLIGSEHYETTINQSTYLDYFYNSFYHIEEPIAEATIPALYGVSRLAAQHVKVVISGQGIDEPLAGYKRYKGEQVISRYKSFFPFLPLNWLKTFFPRNNTISRGIYASKFKDDLDRFIGIYTICTADTKTNLYKSDLKTLVQESHRHYFESALSAADSSNGSLSTLLYTDTRTLLPDNLLLFNDKATMANSIENRVPYLDIDLINFIECLPVEYKLNGSIGKYIHREAVRDWIPNAIINRKKRGFATPVDQWFQKELSETLIDLVYEESSFSRNYFQLPAIKNMIDLHQNKKHNYKNELFLILSLELWYRFFYTKF